MDIDEVGLHEAAVRQGMSVIKHDDGTWGLMSAPSLQPHRPGTQSPVDAIISGERYRLADGRVFPMKMTLAELREALGLEGE